MSKPDARGWMSIKGKPIGGHCYLLNAYYKFENMVRVQNSWGPKWASFGRGYMHVADLERLISEDGEACVGIEKQIQYSDE